MRRSDVAAAPLREPLQVQAIATALYVDETPLLLSFRRSSSS